MNDMDGCIGLNFLDLKKTLTALGKADQSMEAIDVCDAIQEYADSLTERDQDFMYRYGYLMGAADACNCTLGEMIDDINWDTVKAAQTALEKEMSKEKKGG